MFDSFADPYTHGTPDYGRREPIIPRVVVTRLGYSPTDVLQAGPQPTDVLDVLYHVVP